MVARGIAQHNTEPADLNQLDKRLGFLCGGDGTEAFVPSPPFVLWSTAMGQQSTEKLLPDTTAIFLDAVTLVKRGTSTNGDNVGMVAAILTLADCVRRAGWENGLSPEK